MHKTKQKNSNEIPFYIYDVGEFAWSSTWDCRFDVDDGDPAAAAAQ